MTDLNLFKDDILDGFLQRMTPIECAIYLVQRGLNPPPTEEELKADSPFLEDMKQNLIDNFFRHEKVKELLSFGETIKVLTKGTYALYENIFREHERTLSWLPGAYHKILKNKFGLDLHPD